MPPFYQVNASRGYFSMCRGGLAAEGRAWRLRRHACLRRLRPSPPTFTPPC